MSRQPASPATADDILAAIEKLSRHVEGLQRSADRLAERFVPVHRREAQPPDEEEAAWVLETRLSIDRFRRAGKVSLNDLLKLMVRADVHLQDAERSFGYIKAQVEAIANSAVLKADWQEWMNRRSDK